MKTAELEGAELDYWVAKAEGMLRMISGTLEEQLGGYSPSTNWKQGGPIIEREIKSMHCDGGKMMAIGHFGQPGWGATYLEAAMRAYVASKFGDTVPEVK